jgi:hypothetical protein
MESAGEGLPGMKMIFLAVAALLALVAIGPASAADVGALPQEPLDARALEVIGARFRQLMDLANRHDIDRVHEMFWQSPSALLVAKSAIPSEGSWAGFWGNKAIDRKLHDIAASGPVLLEPDLSKLKVVGLTREVAESYAPLNITVSYAGQEDTPRPFLMIITWKKCGSEWKIASEVILPVPPAPAGKSRPTQGRHDG